MNLSPSQPSTVTVVKRIWTKVTCQEDKTALGKQYLRTPEEAIRIIRDKGQIIFLAFFDLTTDTLFFKSNQNRAKAKKNLTESMETDKENWSQRAPRNRLPWTTLTDFENCLPEKTLLDIMAISCFASWEPKKP